MVTYSERYFVWRAKQASQPKGSTTNVAKDQLSSQHHITPPNFYGGDNIVVYYLKDWLKKPGVLVLTGTIVQIQRRWHEQDDERYRLLTNEMEGGGLNLTYPYCHLDRHEALLMLEREAHWELSQIKFDDEARRQHIFTDFLRATKVLGY